MYTGREDNIFWKRTGRGLVAGGAKAMVAGDVAAMPADVIHSVTNPLPRFAAAIHIYGGDFFATERSQWNAETLAEEPSNGDVLRAMFDRENERLERAASR
jgi:predicted metal-dependent enzyme (double-stranded beta helix superfamily)